DETLVAGALELAGELGDRQVQSGEQLHQGYARHRPPTNPDVPKNSRCFRIRQSLDPSGTWPFRPKRPPKLLFAQADGLGCHLDQLVVVNPGQAVLETHDAVRAQANRFVVSRGPDVGQLLLAAHVHDQVDVARVLTDDHALV